jgi:uncharacterized membrane protein YfcA
MPDYGIAVLLIGLLAGVASGMFGIGGGVVIVPALLIFLPHVFNLIQATGTSLGALLMPVGILAVTAYYRAGKIKIGIAVPIAAGLIGGIIVGAQLAQNLPQTLLQQLYGAFLLWTGWRFAEPIALLRRWRSGQAAPTDAEEPQNTASWYALLALGLGSGVMAGLFGIGGGAIIVPALVTLLHFDQKLAIGTSLAALLLPVGLGGVIIYYQNGNMNVPAAVLIALGLLVGALAGAKIALGLPSKTVKQLYGFFLILIGLRFIFWEALLALLGQ